MIFAAVVTVKQKLEKKKREEEDQSQAYNKILLYMVIHKFIRDFRTRPRNNQDRQGRKKHINR